MSQRIDNLSLAEYVKASIMIGLCGGVSLGVFTFLYGMFDWELGTVIYRSLLVLFASTGGFLLHGIIGYPVYWYMRKKATEKRENNNE